MKEKRILHIMSSYGGGISTFIYNLARSAQEQNLIFDVATYSDTPDIFDEIIHKTGGAVFRLKNPKRAGWRSYSKSMELPLKKYHYDAVHCHVSGYRAWAYYQLVKHFQPGLEKDFYIHAHYLYPSEVTSRSTQYKRRIDQKINRHLSRLPLGCSLQAIDSLFGSQEHGARVVIPNSISPDQFMRAPEDQQAIKQALRRRYATGNQEILIGQVGRLVPIKNHAFTLNLVQYSQNKGRPLHLLVAGEGPLKEQLGQQIIQKELTDSVRLLGRVSPIEALMLGLDALIMPSFAEGFGTVAVEAQAAGIPVLTSDQVVPEVDLGLGLVKQLSLETGEAVWYKELIKLIDQNNKVQVSNQARSQAVHSHAFSDQAACAIYRQVLDYQISRFPIE